VEFVRRAIATATDSYDEIIVTDRPRGVRRRLAAHAVDEVRRDPGLPLTRLEADPPMRQGSILTLMELRQHFHEFLRRTTGGPEE
jgi:hypothetical protein